MWSKGNISVILFMLPTQLDDHNLTCGLLFPVSLTTIIVLISKLESAWIDKICNTGCDQHIVHKSSQIKSESVN